MSFRDMQSSLSLAVLEQVHPDTGISNKVTAILNLFINDIFECIMAGAPSTSHYDITMMPSRADSVAELTLHSSEET